MSSEESSSDADWGSRKRKSADPRREYRLVLWLTYDDGVEAIEKYVRLSAMRESELRDWKKHFEEHDAWLASQKT